MAILKNSFISHCPCIKVLRDDFFIGCSSLRNKFVHVFFFFFVHINVETLLKAKFNSLIVFNNNIYCKEQVNSPASYAGVTENWTKG